MAGRDFVVESGRQTDIVESNRFASTHDQENDSRLVKAPSFMPGGKSTPQASSLVFDIWRASQVARRFCVDEDGCG
jgi:hypothetical protein